MEIVCRRRGCCPIEELILFFGVVLVLFRAWKLKVFYNLVVVAVAVCCRYICQCCLLLPLPDGNLTENNTNSPPEAAHFLQRNYALPDQICDHCQEKAGVLLYVTENTLLSLFLSRSLS